MCSRAGSSEPGFLRRPAPRASHLRRDRPLELLDPALVPLVERPLLDPPGPDESRMGEDPHVLAEGRLADAELAGDEHAADAVVDEVAVDLGREMRHRILEPFEDLDPSFVGERPDRGHDRHVDSLPNDEKTVKPLMTTNEITRERIGEHIR